jgi:serine protease Do
MTRNILTLMMVLSIGLVAGVLLSSGFELPDRGIAAGSGSPNTATFARNAQVHPLNNSLESPFVAVARQVVPAVVYVDANHRINHPPIDNKSQSDLFRRLFPNAPREEMNFPSSGSGFIIDDEGHVLTNNHVVEDADDITIHLSDGRAFAGEIIGRDAKTDVAVLKIVRHENDHPLPVVLLGNSDSVEVGEWAVAIGNPLGQLEGSVTVGVVSAKGRSDLSIMGGGPDYQDFIQTDASINFGNSGGPLVNTRGEVIGINTAINPTGQGLSFAIPINMARYVSDQLIATGTVTRAYLGIVPQSLTPELAEGLGIPEVRGILVASVEPAGPADKAGVRQKDVILTMNGDQVTEVNRFRRLVAETPIDTEMKLGLMRQGRNATVLVKLGRRPDETASMGEPDQEPLAADTPPAEWLGARLEALTAEMAQELEVRFVPAVIVTSVEPGSKADEAGLEQGDLVLEANDNPVKSLEDWDRAVQAAGRSNRPVVLLVSRDGATSYIAVRLSRP